MRITRLLLATCFLGSLVSCSKKPTPEYRLTAEQLAWQPYKVGDVLRFGQAYTSKVRTFTIAAVNDQLITLSNSGGGGINLLGSASSSRLEQLLVDVRRTDTVRYQLTSTSTPAKPDSVINNYPDMLLEMATDDNRGDGPVTIRASVNWDYSFEHNLPLAEVLAGQAPADTAAHLLPTLKLGGIIYGPVLQLSNVLIRSNVAPRQKLTRRLYYAKNYGVVGFVEGRTLWYRLP
ncbi:MAG: hypothetical protein ACRYFX_32015 [Janthinobacterium lividum]